jgi:hypothetical protein
MTVKKFKFAHCCHFERKLLQTFVLNQFRCEGITVEFMWSVALEFEKFIWYKVMYADWYVQNWYWEEWEIAFFSQVSVYLKVENMTEIVWRILLWTWNQVHRFYLIDWKGL